MNQQKSTNKRELNYILRVSIVIITVWSFNASAIEPPTMYIHNNYTFDNDWWGYVVVERNAGSPATIQINLNGHKIYGKGRGYGTGIKIDGQHDVEIKTDYYDPKDAFIEDFEYGISITNSHDVFVTYHVEHNEGLYIDNCDYGIYIYNCDNGRFQGGQTYITDCTYGVYSKYCEGFQIWECTIENCWRGFHASRDINSGRGYIYANDNSGYGIYNYRNTGISYGALEGCNNSTGFYSYGNKNIKLYWYGRDNSFCSNTDDGFYIRYSDDYKYNAIVANENDRYGLCVGYGSDSNQFYDCDAHFNGTNHYDGGWGNTYERCDFTD